MKRQSATGRGADARLRLSVQGRERFAGLPAAATLRRWVRLALQGAPRAEITLRFVDSREGRRLNREFRRRDYATNVLTFDYAELRHLTADLVFCVPVIAREARDQNKSLRAHLAHLTLHGVLHACGFDHRRSDERRRMETREIQLLKALRIGNPYVLAADSR
jgi:probable rRNA maturation factor